MCEIHISSRKTISPALYARPCARNFTQVRAFNFKVSADGRAKALIAVSRRASRSPASTSPHPTPPGIPSTCSIRRSYAHKFLVPVMMNSIE